MFEDRTYENLLDEVLEEAPDDIDKREGSVFYDCISAILMKIEKLYCDLDIVIEQTTIATATGDALDVKAGEYGVTRKEATPARYYVNFDGTIPASGNRFFTDELFFVLCYDDSTGVRYLEAEEPGTQANNVEEGTIALPVGTIEGLESATFGLIYSYGTDIEDDESLRDRVQSKIAGPAQNGNKAHYKQWCEEVSGVGQARIYPLWNGPNSVKGVLTGTDGKLLENGDENPVVKAVQEYVDPATKGYRTEVDNVPYIVGDGLGEGAANIGAHFTAHAATACEIGVTVKVEPAGDYTLDEIKTEFTENINTYLGQLISDAEDTEELTVIRTTIGAILTEMKSVKDYTQLKLFRCDESAEEQDYKNITPGEDEIPVLKEVEVEEWT